MRASDHPTGDATDAAPSIDPILFEEFVAALDRLAAPAADQIAYLSVRFHIDELALEFDDGMYLLGQFEAADWVSASAGEPIRALDAELVALSGSQNADFWTHEALRDDVRWVEVRRQAAQVLVALRRRPAERP